jgi:tetratricopeptide (TPR) repeat protein
MCLVTLIVALLIGGASPGPALRGRGEDKPLGSATPSTQKLSRRPSAADFDRLRSEGNEAIYNLDYQKARECFRQMTQIAPDHPAGFVYSANNLWLEILNERRRLSSSLYASGSFYDQQGEQDPADSKRDREFQELISRAVTISAARLKKNPRDAEAVYYQASAKGLRAAYSATVRRSFVRAIGDANESIKLQKQVLALDSNYVDAYLSIGLYEYVIDSLPFVWRTLARIAGLKGSRKKGIEHLQLVVERGKYASDDARVVLIGIFTREGEPEKALEAIRALAEKYPRNYLLGVERGAMLYRSAKIEDGARVFEDLLKNELVIGSAVDLVNYHWGLALETAGNFRAAIDRYAEVNRWSGSDLDLVALAHLHAGRCFDAIGKRDPALDEYEAVLKRHNVFDSHKLASQYIRRAYVPGKVDD